jgi:hypothetical protein
MSLEVWIAGVYSQSASFHDDEVDRGGVSGAEYIGVKERLESLVVGEAGGEIGVRVRRCIASGFGFASN